MLRKSLQHLYTSEETQTALLSAGLLETVSILQQVVLILGYCVR